jgi:hypothetical protein
MPKLPRRQITIPAACTRRRRRCSRRSAGQVRRTAPSRFVDIPPLFSRLFAALQPAPCDVLDGFVSLHLVPIPWYPSLSHSLPNSISAVSRDPACCARGVRERGHPSNLKAHRRARALAGPPASRSCADPFGAAAAAASKVFSSPSRNVPLPPQPRPLSPSPPPRAWTRRRTAAVQPRWRPVVCSLLPHASSAGSAFSVRCAHKPSRSSSTRCARCTGHG